MKVKDRMRGGKTYSNITIINSIITDNLSYSSKVTKIKATTWVTVMNTNEKTTTI